MKILAEGIHGNHISGFQPIFMQEGHQWIWFEENFFPPLKVFDEIRPDLFIGVGEPSKALSKCLDKYQTTSIFQIAPFTYKIQEKILEYSVLLDDITYNNNRDPSNQFNCDIGCFTINKEPNPYLLSLCHPIGKYKIIILGQYKWNIPQHLGECSIEEKVDLYRSAKIIFCETEEEKAKTIACGSIAITPQYEMTLDGYLKVIDEILNSNPTLLIKIKKTQEKWFKSIKTYKDVLPKLMDELNV